MPGWRHHERYDDPTYRMVFATLVTHYWSHGCFLAEGEIFEGMERLAEIPGVLVHGRYDISGPLETAWRFHQAWPASQLVVVEDAGHGGGSFGDALCPRSIGSVAREPELVVQRISASPNLPGSAAGMFGITRACSRPPARVLLCG